ncbi:MAG: DUF4440 domain-containing protein, partial [Gemmatimonadetes bacterium]|nr:DUF4440 domain-containing protein [Gemmatimonadota bacterium]
MSHRTTFTNGSSLAMLAVLVACGPPADLEVEEQAIRDISAQWSAFDEARDAAGVAGLFADDAVLVWEQWPPARGVEEIEAHIARAYLENPSGEGSFAPDRIDVGSAGDLAVEQGTYDGPAGEGRYITVHKKLGGEWNVIADMSVGTARSGNAPEWAVQSLEQWYQAYNGRDAEALADLYTRDARVGDAQGRAAIIGRFRNGWAEEDDRCTGSYDAFQLVGT